MSGKVFVTLVIVISRSLSDPRHLGHKKIYGVASNTSAAVGEIDRERDLALAVKLRPITEVSLQSMSELFEWDEVAEEVPEAEFCGLQALCQLRVTEDNASSFPEGLESTIPFSSIWDGKPGMGPNELTEIVFGATPCHCDTDCVLYGDCCQDAARRWSGQNMETNRFECRSIQPSEDNTPGKLSLFVYMVSHCPDSNTNEYLHRLCEQEVLDDNYHYSLDLPVYSLETRTTYANVYCARCNGDDAFHLHKWNASLTCTPNAKNMSLQDFMKDATYIRGKLSWVRQVRQSSQNVTCNYSVQEFNDVASYLENFNGRRCFPAKRECHSTWSDNNTRLKCEMYAFRVVDNNNTVFKNPHCALCNGIESGLACHNITRSTGLRSRSRPSFSVIFDFLDGGGGKVGHAVRCGQNEFWDDIHEKCHAMVCPSSYELQEGKCVQRKLPLNKPVLDNGSFKTNFSSTDSTSSELDLNESACFEITLNPGEFIVIDNGSVYVNKTEMIYEVGEYEFENGTGVKVCTKSSSPYFKFSDAQGFISQLGLTISLICLAAHIIIYTLLPKLLNMPGKNLLSLACALFMAQLLFLTGVDKNSVKSVCIFIGTSIHWFYLAAFFWMSVMSFDICQTFRSKTYRPERNKRTFLLYSLYGWGGPSLIVGTALSLDSTSFLSEYAPEYGQPLCWINSRWGLAMFFILPVSIILVTNSVFFVLTICSIWSQQKAGKYAQKSVQRKRNPKKSTDKATKQSSDAGKKNRMRFYLYLKLAVIMGLTWIFGFIAATANVPALWYLFIIFNSLQGAAIFVGFDMKRKIFAMLWKRISGRQPTYHFLTGGSRGQGSSNTATTSFTLPADGSKNKEANVVEKSQEAVTIR